MCVCVCVCVCVCEYACMFIYLRVGHLFVNLYMYCHYNRAPNSEGSNSLMVCGTCRDEEF